MRDPALRLRAAELVDTAERLESAYDSEASVIGLETIDREAIIRVLYDADDRDFAELRAVLLREHAWRKSEGALARSQEQVEPGRSDLDNRSLE